MRSMMVTCDAHFSRYSMCSLDVVKKKRRGIVTHSMHGKRCSRCSKCTDLSHSWRLTGLDALRLEPRPLVVDRHVLTLHPHRVVASQVDALSAVQPTTYRQLLEFHADSARRVAWADAACIRSARASRHSRRWARRARRHVHFRATHPHGAVALSRACGMAADAVSTRRSSAACRGSRSAQTRRHIRANFPNPASNTKGGAKGKTEAWETHHGAVGYGTREMNRLHLMRKLADERIDGGAVEAGRCPDRVGAGEDARAKSVRRRGRG